MSPFGVVIKRVNSILPFSFYCFFVTFYKVSESSGPEEVHSHAAASTKLRAQFPLSYVFILCIGHTYLGSRGTSWSKFTVATLRQDSKTRTLYLSLGLICWTQLRNVEDIVSLFGVNLHGGVISGCWCLKVVFGLLLLSLLLSFCVT